MVKIPPIYGDDRGMVYYCSNHIISHLHSPSIASIARRNPPGPGQCSSAPRGPRGRGPGGHCGAAVGGAASEAGLAARCGWMLLRILLGKFGKGVGKSKYFFYTKNNYMGVLVLVIKLQLLTYNLLLQLS